VSAAQSIQSEMISAQSNLKINEALGPVTVGTVPVVESAPVEQTAPTSTEEPKPSQLLKPVDEWQMTRPIEMNSIEEALEKYKKNDDKSFFMDTSQIKIIDEDDIEDYNQNKK